MYHETTLAEALEVVRSCQEDLYPPTNPAVLMKTMLAIYRDRGAGADFRAVLDWLYIVGYAQLAVTT